MAKPDHIPQDIWNIAADVMQQSDEKTRELIHKLVGDENATELHYGMADVIALMRVTCALAKAAGCPTPMFKELMRLTWESVPKFPIGSAAPEETTP